MVVVQLVERCIWDAEAVGSSPAYHTIFFKSGYDAIGSNRVLETRRWEFESLYPDKMLIW